MESEHNRRVGRRDKQAVACQTTESRHTARSGLADERQLFIAKFHYTGPTGPARTFFAARVSERVRAGPCGSGRARVVEFSLYDADEIFTA